MPDRVAVFIDYQNCYKRSRHAFYGEYPPNHMCGQVLPRRLALLLKGRAAGDRELVGVWIYRGMPSSKHDPKAHAAADRQIGMWDQQNLVHPYSRTLNYRDPDSPKEKGIDVKLAIDMTMMAQHNDYDVAVLASQDTDLLPALEAVVELKKGAASAVETVAWVPNDGTMAKPLKIKGLGHLIHRLDETDYLKVHDDTDYLKRRRRR